MTIPTLPNELLIKIFSTVSSTSDLYHLLQASNRFATISRPFLYHHIIIQTKSQRGRLRYIREMDKKLVKKLTIKGDGPIEMSQLRKYSHSMECRLGNKCLLSLYQGELLDISSSSNFVTRSLPDLSNFDCHSDRNSSHYQRSRRPARLEPHLHNRCLVSRRTLDQWPSRSSPILELPHSSNSPYSLTPCLRSSHRIPSSSWLYSCYYASRTGHFPSHVRSRFRPQPNWNGQYLPTRDCCQPIFETRSAFPSYVRPDRSRQIRGAAGTHELDSSSLDSHGRFNPQQGPLELYRHFPCGKTLAEFGSLPPSPRRHCQLL